MSCDDWRPIDSAPKDSPVIIASADGRVGEGRIFEMNAAGLRHGDKLGDLRGLFLRPDSWGESYCIPVAWMPLPPPPELPDSIPKG